MSEYVDTMIKSIAAGDNVDAQQQFYNAINDKLSSAIEARRIEVAKNMIQSAEGGANEDI